MLHIDPQTLVGAAAGNAAEPNRTELKWKAEGLTGWAAWMAALRCHGSGSKRKWHILGEILWSYLGYCDSVVAPSCCCLSLSYLLLLLLVFLFFPVLQNMAYTHTYIYIHTYRKRSVCIRQRQTQINISGPRTDSRASSSELVRHFYCRAACIIVSAVSIAQPHRLSLSRFRSHAFFVFPLFVDVFTFTRFPCSFRQFH